MDQSPAAVAQRLAFNKRALILAIKAGNTKPVVELLDRGVSIDTKDDEGMSLLHWAAWGGHVTTMRLLIRRGCGVDSVDGRGLTPLHWAAAMGQTKAVRELIRKGASKSVVAGSCGTLANSCTSLHSVAASGRTQAVRELLKFGAAKSVVGGNCGTPLHLAALYGHVETAITMLEEGCPLDVVSSAGSTVLHFAAAGGNVDLVRKLIGRGCDVNAVEANRCTPLHAAGYCGRTEAVRELIKLGAATSVVAGNYGTPLHLAALYGHVETAIAMLEEGCPLDVVSSAGSTVLHFAAAGGNVDLVRKLIGRGCDVNAVEANRCTPLHAAGYCGRTEAVRELIKLGAATSVVAGNYGTPLHQAAYGGHVETAVAMLEEGCPLDVVSSAGSTVLHYAAAGGNVDLVRELIDRGCDVNAVEANRCTPLHGAAACGRTEAVRELIKLGAAKSVVGGNCGTPLHLAALYGHVETAIAMLKEGCPLDVVNSDGATVLHFAAEGGNVELVKAILDRGCNVNVLKANGCTPLHSAGYCGRTEAVHELIKHGAAKSLVAGNCGTPLHQAALYGHVETARAMLEEGCPLDVVDSDGATVLHAAAEGGNVELVSELVDRGCNVNVLQANGGTPLHAAGVCGRTEVVHELIKRGAEKSVVAGDCGTPLHQAALNGHVETTVAMLEEGCSLDVVDSDRATVLHAAAEGGNVKLVRELIDRGCDVNAVKANGCTPLHFAAGSGRIEAVHELIQPGATKLVVAGNFGTPLHQAVLGGHLETVEVMLQDSVSYAGMSKDDAFATCTSLGITPVMSAGLYGQVEVFKLLISKGGSISNRDIFSLCVFEHCFVGGNASKLHLFCEASGIRSSGEGLRGALATLITQGLVDAHKVLCLCAITGDILFLEDQFIELVASDVYVMPAAVKCAKHYFCQGEGVSFLSKLRILDENALNPLQMALLSLKCFEMGFAIGSVKCGAKDYTSFITKLLSHPVLKETVRKNFPNGLSSLDLAQQFELHHIAELIKRAGGRPGLWAGVPQEIEQRHFLALSQVKEAYSSFKVIAEDGEHGLEFINDLLSNVLQQPLWQKQAATVGANVGAETDIRKFRSLPPMASDDEVSDLIDKCNIDINAMLNHSEGGTIHFGIGSSGRVEVGLYLEQNKVVTKLRNKVGDMLRMYWHPVESSFAQVEPVDLQNDKKELTGRWRFDIVVKPHQTVVQLARKETGYYRHGATSVPMTYGEFVRKIRAEPICQQGPMGATVVDGSVSSWDPDTAATVGANVGAERADHEYKSLMGPVGGGGQPARNVHGVVRRVGGEECRIAINAMLNYPTGGCIHYGIYDNGIVQEGLDLEQNEVIDELRRKVGDVLSEFWPPVDSSYAHVEPVNLQNVEDQRWRFDIVVKPHPTVVLLSEDQPAYCRWGPQCHKMVHHVLAEKVRCEPAGQLPHGD